MFSVSLNGIGTSLVLAGSGWIYFGALVFFVAIFFFVTVFFFAGFFCNLFGYFFDSLFWFTC